MPGFEDLWFNEVYRLRRDADDEVESALTKAGWEHTSSTPGSYWMWVKEIDGRSYCVPLATAARIQEHAAREAYFDQYPDELGD